MVRSFQTSTLRSQTELSGKTWDFSSPVGTIENVYVPSCWETYPGLERYRGTCMYQTMFTGGGNLRLVFKGVSFFAKVFLDGEPVGSHYNAYTPFDCVVKHATQGEHTLSVEVNNEFTDQSALHVPNDYRSWGGISRAVAVETLADAYIQYLHAVPYQADGVWHLKLKARLQSLTDRVLDTQVVVSLANQNVSFPAVTLAAGEYREIETDMCCPNVKTYELAAPKLYEVRATLHIDETAVDDLIERVGFRTVTVKDKQILFNGKPISIRGFNRHESHGVYGCAIPYQEMVRDLEIMKDLNANAVRTCHYPNDELFLDLCDEQGILVWEESHTRSFNLQQMQHPLYRHQVLDCIQEMIQEHINHPSIFIWGCLNECQSNADYGRECYIEQFDALRRLDSSRPVTSASCHPGMVVFDKDSSLFIPQDPTFHDGDICLDLDDVVSYNIYPRWYYDLDPAKQMQRLVQWIDENNGKNKPLIISELGASGITGFHSPTHDMWSEERQADIIEETVTAAFENPDIIGVFLWQFCDTLVDEGWGLTRPKTMNNKGVVDEFRRPKMGYETIKRLFRHYGESARD